MDDVLGVQVDERLDELADVARGDRLAEPRPGLLHEDAIEVSVGHVLEDQVEELLVCEVAEHLEDVLVVQVRVDLDFPRDELDVAGAGDELLVDALEHADEVAASHLRQVHPAEPATAQRPAHAEPTDAPVFRIEGEGGGGLAAEDCVAAAAFAVFLTYQHSNSNF